MHLGAVLQCSAAAKTRPVAAVAAAAAAVACAVVIVAAAVAAACAATAAAACVAAAAAAAAAAGCVSVAAAAAAAACAAVYQSACGVSLLVCLFVISEETVAAVSVQKRHSKRQHQREQELHIHLKARSMQEETIETHPLIQSDSLLGMPCGVHTLRQQRQQRRASAAKETHAAA